MVRVNLFAFLLAADLQRAHFFVTVPKFLHQIGGEHISTLILLCSVIETSRSLLRCFFWTFLNDGFLEALFVKPDTTHCEQSYPGRWQLSHCNRIAHCSEQRILSHHQAPSFGQAASIESNGRIFTAVKRCKKQMIRVKWLITGKK